VNRDAELKSIMSSKYVEMRNYSIPSVDVVPGRVTGAGKSILQLSNASNVWVKWDVVSLPKGVKIGVIEGVLMMGESVDIGIDVGEGENG
jgi:hypothetical protein